VTNREYIGLVTSSELINLLSGA